MIRQLRPPQYGKLFRTAVPQLATAVVSHHPAPSNPPIDVFNFVSTLLWMAEITAEDTLTQADAIVVRKAPDAVVVAFVAGLERFTGFVAALNQQPALALWPKIQFPSACVR
ncbi:hypothetical protein G3M48_008240 [Beauveria asiatica]|uniref:Uncharacterized protein n=1 Tax=Beauveria asiatica TaxID=1069075 RepID=A0AAW0S4B9_9HYPO